MLSEDHFSNYQGKDKKFILYGSKGAKVRIVADHDNVKIVEDVNGRRFPLPESKLREL